MSERAGNHIERASSAKENYDADIEGLKRAFNHFFQAFKQQNLDPKLAHEIKSLIKVGRFRGEQLEEDPKLGFTGSKARILYGDWISNGNMEGSLYTIDREARDVLRVRREGKAPHVQVFLNGLQARFDVLPKPDGTCEVELVYFGGRHIHKVTDEGFRVGNPDGLQWNIDLMNHQDAVRREERKWFGKKNMPEMRPMPQPIVIPYDEVEPLMKETVEKIQKGFALTILTYEEAAQQLRKPPAIGHQPEES